MKFYIFEENDGDTGKPYFCSYKDEGRTQYITCSVRSVEDCEERTNRKLAPEVVELKKVVEV